MTPAPTTPAPTPTPAAPAKTGTLSAADQAKFDSILQAHNYVPPTTATGSSKPAQTWKSLISPPAASTFGGDLKDDFTKRTDAAAQAQNDARDGKQSKGSAVLQTLGEGAGMVGDVAIDTGKALDRTFTGGKIGETLTSLIQKAAGTPQGQDVAAKIKEFTDAHPEAAKNLGAIFNIAGLIPGGGLGAEGAEFAAKAGSKTAKAIAEGSGKIVEGAADAGNAAKEVMGDVKINMAKKNAGQQLESSAKRLKDPIATYDELLGHQEGAMKDVKSDNAMNVVGGRIGDAFDKVVKQRQSAGKAMSEEIKKFGSTKTDTSSALADLNAELHDSNLEYDVKEKKTIASGQTKMSTADRKIIEKYASELTDLGHNPSAADLDAFISRMPKEIEGLKADNKITFNTNAERIVKKNLSSLRDTLAEVGSPEYKAAKKQYADLSKFIDEGSTHLGKITQSGDYAKDASLSKSAVQSLLNNGKKDWLHRLEELTGYPALDESVLGLQAMKDSGDFRGNSLLELLSKDAEGGHIPTSQAGVLSKILNWGVQKGSRAINGTPAEQTRAFLKSLKDK